MVFTVSLMFWGRACLKPVAVTQAFVLLWPFIWYSHDTIPHHLHGLNLYWKFECVRWIHQGRWITIGTWDENISTGSALHVMSVDSLRRCGHISTSDQYCTKAYFHISQLHKNFSHVRLTSTWQQLS